MKEMNKLKTETIKEEFIFKQDSQKRMRNGVQQD